MHAFLTVVMQKQCFELFQCIFEAQHWTSLSYEQVTRSSPMQKQRIRIIAQRQETSILMCFSGEVMLSLFRC